MTMLTGKETTTITTEEYLSLTKRVVEYADRLEYISTTVSVGAEERRKEFHERLKRNVAKLTCDVQTSRNEFWAYMDKLSKDQLATLANVLRLELLQVIKAVEEAK